MKENFEKSPAKKCNLLMKEIENHLLLEITATTNKENKTN